MTSKYGAVNAYDGAEAEEGDDHVSSLNKISFRDDPGHQRSSWWNYSNSNSDMNPDGKARSSQGHQSMRDSILYRVEAMHDLRQSVSRSTGQLLRNSVTLSFGGRQCSVRSLGGTASVPNEFFNLVKNLVGAGMLALPSGVAAFANAPSAIIPGVLLTFLMGAIFGYYFLLIGRTCRITRTATYREVWESTMGDSETLAVLVSLVNTTKPALGNLAYSMILADTFRSLFAAIGWDVSRTVSLLLITVIGLLPLCLMKNLKVLAPTSIIGVIGFALTTVVMGIRYFDGSYTKGGKFATDMREDYRPSFGTVGASGSWTSFRALVLACMLFEAFVAHYNAPRFYTELKNNTVPRFATVVGLSFGASGLIYALVLSFGFLTFGSSCDGYILNNYSNNDMLASVCRLCVAVALVCTYPVTFLGVRDGFLDLCHVPMSKHTSTNLNIVSVFLLTIITIIAASFRDLGMINAVGGGSLGTIVVFVFPALMYKAAVEQQRQDYIVRQGMGQTQVTTAQVWEANFSIALMWFGIAMGTIGVYLAINKGD